MQKVLRHEIKFPLQYEQYCCLEQRLFSIIPNLQNPYPDRIVNSLYYDDYIMTDYHNNVSGITPREKIRLRWYNNDKKGNIELKYKNGNLGLKKTIKLNQTIQSIAESGINNQKIDKDLLNSWNRRNNKTLYVRYNRKYFELHNGIRLTIDSDIRFAKDIDKSTIPSSIYCVLEIKFDKDLHDEATKIIQDLGYRYYRNSKYVIGINTLYL